MELQAKILSQHTDADGSLIVTLELPEEVAAQVIATMHDFSISEDTHR